MRAKLETNEKRMIANIQRNKTTEVKLLENNVAVQLNLNEDFNLKQVEEGDKHDALLDELIQLRETLKRRKEV